MAHSSLYRLHDILIARTPAEIAREGFPNLGWRWILIALEKRNERHQEARGTKAALQRVLLAKCVLERMQLAVGCQALNRRNLMAIRLNGEHEARANRLPVEENGAAAANSVLAAQVSAGEA
jgi:hypothetical protein